MGLSLSVVLAQNTLTWTGGGTTDNWSDINNWGGVGIPDATNNILIFDGTTRLNTVNDIAGLTIRQIQFGTSAGAFNLSGNSFVLGDAAGPNDTMLFGAPTITNVTINNNITFGRAQNWAATNVAGYTNPSFYGTLDLNNYNWSTSSTSMDLSFYGSIINGAALDIAHFFRFNFSGNTYTFSGPITHGAAWVNLYNGITLNSDITTASNGNRLYSQTGNNVINGDLTLNGSPSAFDFLVYTSTLEVNGNVTSNVGIGCFIGLGDIYSGGTPGVDWGQLIVNGGDLVYGPSALLRLWFAGGGNPDQGSPFWNNTRRWLINDLDTGTLTTNNLIINNGVWTNGYFFYEQVGNDLYLNWQVAPEPSTWAMLGVGLVLGAVVANRRRRP